MLRSNSSWLLICNICGVIRWCGPVLVLIALLAGCSAISYNEMLKPGEIQFGIASWYGGEFHNRNTTSGEKYDMNQFTAAHRMLPFGTLVRVTNTKNGRTVVVRINDRGPQKPDRVIDLSHAAARKIGMVQDGVVRVKLEIVDEQTGTASLYEQEFYDQQIASSKIYDIDQLTSAYSMLRFRKPIWTAVRFRDKVIQSQEGIISLSRWTAEELGMLNTGITRVAIDTPAR